MPRYDYRCRTCEATFEHAHPMSEAGAPTPCPQGHPDTVKLLSTVALGGRSQGGPAGMAAGPAAGGGCCGGACGCGG